MGKTKPAFLRTRDGFINTMLIESINLDADEQGFYRVHYFVEDSVVVTTLAEAREIEELLWGDES